MRTGLNVRHADEQLRGTIALPNGLGKSVTVAVFAKGDKAREAEEAGADVVGAEDLARRVEQGFTDFDVAIATPDMMPVVGRLGRILGPQGKMPNPKVGTVTMDVGKAVEESKAGKVEYRTDRTAIVHLTIGKTSFDDRALLENYAAVIDEIIRAKPSAAKGRYIRSITLASTMGPGREGRPEPHARHPRGGCARRRVARHRATEDLGRAPRCAAPEVPNRRPMNRDQKAAAIAEIADQIEQSEAVFAVDFRGISVPQAADVRTRLRDADASFRVVKNTLTERAADEAGAEALKPLLEGPTALTFVRGDAALAAKAIATFNRETQLLSFKGGLHGRRRARRRADHRRSRGCPRATSSTASSSASSPRRSPAWPAASTRCCPAWPSRSARCATRRSRGEIPAGAAPAAPAEPAAAEEPRRRRGARGRGRRGPRRDAAEAAPAEDADPAAGDENETTDQTTEQADASA